MSEDFITVLGLEIHLQLNTKTKMFSPENYFFGGLPNTQIHPVSLALPGTLPLINKEVIKSAIKLGLSLNCDINKYNLFARKNYFYSDLPKGYQITQFNEPICSNGEVIINKNKKIQLTRIHVEEDTGKSIHDQDPFNSLIDLNRAGVPLLEIVTEPDIRNEEEACSFLYEIRKIVRYLEISNGNMEEGSLRCDANISICRKNDTKFGTKVEIKNMNSINNVKQAILYEKERQIELIKKNKTIKQETRLYDAINNKTISMRSKEESNDYRYFHEPDLLPVIIKEEEILNIKNNLPPLPDELKSLFMNKHKLNEYDTNILTEDKTLALYYLEVVKENKNYKTAANFIIGKIKSYLNENGITIKTFKLNPEKISKLIDLISSGKINYSTASNIVFPIMIQNITKDPEKIVLEENLTQESDDTKIELYIEKAIKKYPEKVKEYQNGKKGLIGLFMGEIMKLSKGKTDPKKTNILLNKKLNESK